MSPEEARKGWVGRTKVYLRAWVAALTDERTYDVRQNPSLWLGFLLAIPIPVLTFAAEADTWLKLLTLLSPVTWAVLLGATGAVTQRLIDQRNQLRTVVESAETEARAAREDLGVERELREALEREREQDRAELRLAQSVQETIESKNIHREDCEVVIHSLPSKFVGGDYVHANVVEGRWLYLCIADVSGHGIAAALVVARIHGLVRRLTLTRKRPEPFLERINRATLQIFKDTYFFMTMGIFRVDLRTGELEYATAGHPTQVLLHEDGTHEDLRTNNRLLGMDADIFDKEQPTKRLQLRPGDTIVLFTDGLFEILEDGKGEVLEESGLHRRIESVGTVAPGLLIGEVLQGIAEFQGHSQFEDDVTMVAARWNGPVTMPAPMRERRADEAPRS
jgi:sigma-B regulation protein RsbU (phosphoserine phosphatase)